MLKEFLISILKEVYDDFYEGKNEFKNEYGINENNLQEDKKELKNYRPLTMLNTDLKNVI